MPPLPMAPALLFFNLAIKFAVILALAAVMVRISKQEDPDFRRKIWLAALLSLLVLTPVTWLSPYPESSLFPGLQSDWNLYPQQIDPGDKENTETITAWAVPIFPRSGRKAAGLWLSVASLLLAHLLFGHIAAARIKKRTRFIRDFRLNELLRESARKIGLRCRPRLGSSEHVQIPAVVGFRRPVILIPCDMTKWPSSRLRPLLIHELAHLKNHDLAWRFIFRLICSIFWFNPLVWYAYHNLKVEQEMGCDRFAVSSGVAPSFLAEILLQAKSLNLPRPKPAVAAWAQKSQLKLRILCLLTAHQNPDGGHRRRRIIAVTAVVSLAVLMLINPWNPATARGRQTTIFRHKGYGSSGTPAEKKDGKRRIYADSSTHTWKWI